MIAKIYRYKLAPGKWRDFIELQKRVDVLYTKHLTYEISFVRDLTDPTQITEIHMYPDLHTAKKAEKLHLVESDLSNLFDAFKAMLDPLHNEVEEVMGEASQVRN